MPTAQFLQKLGLQFKNPDFFELALTHSSYAHEQKWDLSRSNERLEFLGDSVLNFCVAEMLVSHFPKEPEGKLSKRRAALVNQKQLSRISQEINLGQALHLGKGEEKTGGRTKESVLGDAFEALVGAIYLDQGIEAARAFLTPIFSPLMETSEKVEISQDYKTQLQEFYQRRFKKSPRYQLKSTSGPDHAKVFSVKVEFQGEFLADGQGRSKRDAEQDAARKAFLALQRPRGKKRDEK